MRSFALVSMVFASGPAAAQAISGTFGATFQGFDTFGVPTTRLELDLACSLTCTPSAPELTFLVAGGVDATFASAPMVAVGYVGSGFGSDPTGVNLHDSTEFPAGSAFIVTAKSASCHCGNATGQGGYVDVSTPISVIPPYVAVGTSTATVGYEWDQLIDAQPQGAETVVVHLTGAGVERTVTLGAADFPSGVGSVAVTPTSAGTLEVTATLMPYGAGHTGMVPVMVKDTGSGGGSGTGGGGDALGGGTSGGADSGCAAAPSLAMVPFALLGLLRRRRALRASVVVLAWAALAGCSGGGGGGTGGGSAGGGTGSNGGGTSSNGGGTSSNGGGTSSNGGGTSSNGGGTSSNGGGTATGGGDAVSVGTFLRVGMYEQVFAGGPDGTMHLLFNEGAAERVFYGRCSSSCSDPASWSPVQLGNVSQLGLLSVGAAGIGVDASGRVHALISGVPSSGSANTMVYATCASNCGSAGSWSMLDISSVSVENNITTTGTFMVTPAGELSFLTGGQFNSTTARYVTCSAGCTALASWTAGAVLNGNPVYAARDAAGVTHVVLNQGETAMGDSLHFYGRCASNCTQGASWQISALGFIHALNDSASGFAVTPQGTVYLAFNQGVAMASTADNHKLLVDTCSGSTCLDLNTWSSFSLGAADEGSRGTWLTAAGEALVMATLTDFAVNVRTCTVNCDAAAGWSAVTVADDATLMNQAVPPDTGSDCPGSSESASWWPNRPRLGVSANGVVLGHSPYAIVKCPGSSPAELPTIGRIAATF